MNKNAPINYIKKASLISCLFLFSIQAVAVDNLWQFDPELQKVYTYVTNLQTQKAREALKHVKNTGLHKLYVEQLNETLYILITEDHASFTRIDELFKQNLKHLESLPESAETLFLQAELNLQRGFCLLNLSQELNAVLAIRRAYQLTAGCISKYPNFTPIKKTSGVIQVMVGAVPTKYQWFISLLGMKGSVATGQKQLSEVKNSKSSLSAEGGLLYYTIQGFINQQFTEAANGITATLKEQPENRLMLFIGVNMLVKDARGEEALGLIHQIEEQKEGLAMPYIDYLKGEVLLQKGSYTQSIESFQKFIRTYPSVSFKKDSHFKISLCYWLLNDTQQAKLYFEKAKTTGADKAEPDKYAARQLLEPNLPNKKLLKARFSTDGGYYKEAATALASITISELGSLKDKTEYYYRKARLAHRTGEIAAAKLFYQQSIDMTKNNPWYFGANSALQMGYIAKDQKDYTNAKRYFELALSYPKHEYKDSIDSKAKSELELLSSVKA